MRVSMRGVMNAISVKAVLQRAGIDSWRGREVASKYRSSDRRAELHAHIFHWQRVRFPAWIAAAEQLERIDQVGHPFWLQQRRPVHHLKVEVRLGGAAGVSDKPERLTALHPIAGLDPQSAGLE